MIAVLVAFGVTTLLLNVYLAISTRKEIHRMSLALDNLTAGVAQLEASAASTTTQIAALQAAGENAPALDALTVRIKAVNDSLLAAIATKV